jgi:hypothetical protein
VDFRDALNIVTAELTPQPWDYTADDGTTLRVIPAGLREDAGYAEVLVRVTRADATGLCEFGITGPDSRGVAEVGVTTAGLPALIEALTERIAWEDTGLVFGALAVTPAADGVMVRVTEIHGRDQEVVSTVLPEAQRLPLASALRRALDVARGWEETP